MKLKKLAFPLAAAVLITLLVASLDQVSLFQQLEAKSLDWRFLIRNHFKPSAPDPRIILVGIDDSSIGVLGAWPFPRHFHADVLQLLSTDSPAVVTWDILFTEPRIDDPDSDVRLVDAVKLFPALITGATRDDSGQRVLPDINARGPTQPLIQIHGDPSKLFHAAKAQLPFDNLLANSRFGFVDCEPWTDGARRYLPMIVDLDGAVYPSLALESVIQLLKLDPAKVEVNIGQDIVLYPEGKPPIHIPIDASGQLLVNYRNVVTDFDNITYAGLAQLLKLKADGQPFPAGVALPKINGSLVVFGFTGEGFDTGSIPLSKNTPLVAVHLNAINDILQQDFLRPAPMVLTLIGYFLLVFLLAWVMSEVHLSLSLGLAVLAILGYSGLSVAAFVYDNLWVSSFLPVIGLFVLFSGVISRRYLGEQKDKAAVKKALGNYLSSKVLDEVLRDPANVRLGGVKKEISIMFCDIRGFTKYCDEREPAEVVEVLNEYLEIMTNVILKYDGTIDKYVGDCIMAFWGAPQDQPDHAQRAVCAAMEMRYVLSNYKTKRAGIDRELFECGIGINTGDALVGNMGSSRFMNYSVIGAHVNLAARLESLTKPFNVRIIISESTRRQIEGDFTFTDLGEVSVPGFRNKFRLYSLEALQDISSALSVGRTLAKTADYQADEVTQPLWEPAPLPEDADPNP